VFARAFVRWLEVQQSLRFVTEQLNALPSGEVAARVGGLAPNAIACRWSKGGEERSATSR